MITKRTRDALHIMRILSEKREKQDQMMCHDGFFILRCLESSGIVRLLDSGHPRRFSSWELCRDIVSVSLYEVIIALNEGVRPISCTEEELWVYDCYGPGPASRTLGVANTMLQQLLSDIRACDVV